MKKITMICMAALLLLAASCKKEKNEQINENGGEGLGFSVKTEVHSGDSKTYLLDRQVLWDTDDQIKVYNTNGDNAVFTYVKLVEEEDGTTAEFNSNDVTASFFKPNYRGYYPTNFDPTNYTLSQHQTYTIRNIGGVNRPTFAKGANPMMATNEPDEYLHFKNVLGILQLQFYSDPTDDVIVKEIRVRSNKLSQKLWGNGSVNGDGEFVVTSGGSNTVILDCLDANVTLSHDASNPTSFFILLPPNTLNDGLEVDVVDSYGEFWITKTTNNNIINRSRIRKMPALSVKTCTSEDVQLWAVANANDHNKAPYWATKNLGAENPWNYGDYYQWGATKKYYNDRGYGNIATLYAPENKPAQTGGNVTITLRSNIPCPSTTANVPNRGYSYNTNCPYCLGQQGEPGDIGRNWSNYISATQLDAIDDIVYEETGGRCHLPSQNEFKQLHNNTTRTAVNNYHGVNGSKYYGEGDYDNRFIFCPASGTVGTYAHKYQNYSFTYSGDPFRTEDRGSGGTVYLWSSTRQTQKYNAYCFTSTSYSYNDYCNRWIAMAVRGIRTVTGD